MVFRSFLLLALVLLLFPVPFVRADLPFDRWAVQEDVVPHGGFAGATGECSIAYYDICSNWIRIYGWGVLGDEAGVGFDLPVDCDEVPGASCTNTEFWWYWRYTVPGYDYTVSYRLYEADEDYCKVGFPLGELTLQDPVERWNHYDGLGTVEADLVVLTATLDTGSRPWLVSDYTAKNHEAGCAPIPTELHSFYFGQLTTQYCPPQWFGDEVGPVNILMDASFSCEATSTKPASWGAVKGLFR